MSWLQAVSLAIGGRGPITNEMTKPDDPARFFRWLAATQPAGVKVTMESALELSAVFACCQAIATSIASSEWLIYESQYVSGFEKRTIIYDDPLMQVLNIRPNPDMTAIGFREAMFFIVLTWGNAYAEIVKDRAGRVVRLWPLDPGRMTPRRRKGGELYYEYWEQDGGKVEVPADNIYHLRGPGISGLMGDNRVARAAKMMGLSAAQERFASTYFGNNTVLGGFLEYPKGLDDKTFYHLRDTWEDRFRGPDKSNKPAILENGMKWNQIQSNADDSQLTESRKFQLEEICRYYAVPPHKVQHLDRMTYNNVEHLAIEFVREALTPWAKRAEQEATYKLFGIRSRRKTSIDLRWLSQGDYKTRMEGYAIGRRIGVLSANDIRAMENMNSIGKEGDVRTIESNMQTLDSMVAQTKPEFKPDVLKAGIPTINEVRQQLALPPIAGGDIPANSLLEVRQPSANPLQQAQDPLPEGEGDLPEGSEQGTPAPLPFTGGKPATAKASLIVGEAVTTLFWSALDRYARRLEHREEDLTRRRVPAAKMTLNLANERIKLRPWLITECSNAIKLVEKLTGQQYVSEERVLLAADEVDNGEDPREAAERLVHFFISAVQESKP